MTALKPFQGLGEEDGIQLSPIPVPPVPNFETGACQDPLNVRRPNSGCQNAFELSQEEILPSDPAKRKFITRRMFNEVDFGVGRVGNAFDRQQVKNAQYFGSLPLSELRKIYGDSLSGANTLAAVYEQEERMLGLALLRNDTEVAELADRNMQLLRRQVEAYARLSVLVRRLALLKHNTDIDPQSAANGLGAIQIPVAVVYVLWTVGSALVVGLTAAGVSEIYLWQDRKHRDQSNEILRSVEVQKKVIKELIEPCKIRLLNAGVSKEEAEMRCRKQYAPQLDLQKILDAVRKESTFGAAIEKSLFVLAIGGVAYLTLPLVKEMLATKTAQVKASREVASAEV